MAKKKTINDEENGAIRKAIPAKAKAKVGKKISIKSASEQPNSKVADVEIKKVIQDKENTDIVVDSKTQRQVPKTKKLPTNKKGYTPKVKVNNTTNTNKDNSDSQIITETSGNMLPQISPKSATKAADGVVPNIKGAKYPAKRKNQPKIETSKVDVATNEDENIVSKSAAKAVDGAAPNLKGVQYPAKLKIQPRIETPEADVANNESETVLPKQLIKLTAHRNPKPVSDEGNVNKTAILPTPTEDKVQNKKTIKPKKIKLQLRKSNPVEHIKPEIETAIQSIATAKPQSTEVRIEPTQNNDVEPKALSLSDTEIKAIQDKGAINTETSGESPFDQALSNEALRRKQYWANRKKNKKLAIAAAAERRALALAKANEDVKKEEIPTDIKNDNIAANSQANPKPTVNDIDTTVSNPRINPKQITVKNNDKTVPNIQANLKQTTNNNQQQRKPIVELPKINIEQVEPINADEDSIKPEVKLIGKNAAKNRKNKKNKKLRKLANTLQSDPIIQSPVEENTTGKKANLLKFVITKDKIANLDGVEIPAPKLPIKVSDDKPEILHTRTNVQIAKNKIVLEKSPKRNFDSAERKSLPIISIKQVIKAKSAVEIVQIAPNDIEKKKAIADLLSEIQKEPKSKLKVKIILSEKKESLKSDLNQAEREERYQKKKKKKKNQVNKYEAEALASKDEIIELPPEDFIKMTFPEKSEHKHDLEENSISRVSSYTEINLNRRISNLSKVSPLVQEMINSVKQNLTEEFYLFPNARFLLAVSGGVDSIVMLDIMAQLAEELKITIAVAHFNHNLRGLSSDNDEELVKKICLAYGIKCYTGSENIIKYASDNAISIEQAARHRRYKMFERLSGNLKIDFVTTAHTADDSVETFLLNLLRGTGLTGLSGIPRKRHLVKNTYIIRPIIDFKKSDIYLYAKERNLQWREDETNTLTNYTRNKIRLDLLPKIQQDFSPAIFDLINRTSRLIRGADEFINEFVESAVDTIIKDRRKDRFYISISQLETYSEFIQGEVIRACLSNVFKLLPPNIKVIDRILSLINSPSGAIADINKQIYALKDRGVIIFAQRTPIDSVNMLIDRNCEINLEFATLKLTPIDRKSVEFTKDPLVEYLDADLLPAKLQLRNWEQGDEFKPLGMEGTMKISDFLINQKIPSVEKRGVIVLTTKTDIIWVVGRRLCNTYKVTGNTQKVIKAELILKKEKGK